MATKPKPTKAQLDYARARARASGIDMNQSAKGLRNASKAIVAAASLTPAGRAVKGAKAVKFAAQRANFSRGTVKVAPMLKKKTAVKPGDTVRIKSGGDIKPATSTKTRGNNRYRIGRAELPEMIQRQITNLGESFGGKGATVKIKSGGDIKPAVAKKVKARSYNQLKDMPNLIKIDSAKGNKVKKIAYRRRTSN
jgi:signal peptidase I